MRTLQTKFYEQQLLTNIAKLEDLTGEMFHIAYPELNYHYEKPTKTARTLMLLNNTICKRIEELEENQND